MSYCRWSCDNFACDAYVYEAVDGWYVHLASSRVVGPVPKIPPWDFTKGADNKAFFDAHKAQMDFMRSATFEPLTLPEAGESFVFGDPGACADKVAALIAVGYNIPQGVVDALREEQDLDNG